jgi:hypothetical protein
VVWGDDINKSDLTQRIVAQFWVTGGGEKDANGQVGLARLQGGQLA